MSRLVSKFPPRKAVRAGAALVAVAITAACSSTADRVSSAGDPRYAGASSTRVASVDRSHTSSIPGGSYSRDVSSGPLDGGTVYSTPTPVYSSPSQSPSPVQSTARGGTVIVAPGDTLYSIARANNVHVNNLIAANRIAPPYGIQVGQRLVVPGGYGVTAAPTAVGGQGVSYHDVGPGETLYSISRQNGLTPDQVARYNNIAPPYTLRIGQRLQIPGGSGGHMQARSYSEQQSAPVASASTRVASIPPSSSGSMTDARDAEQPRRPTYTGRLPDPQPRAASKFRWPVKGRIISRFGTKPNGARNDGINIAVPVGTSVRASENGVVAYAGNELKGYGNLVLIRHADNWVTAYAHNNELFVQRGDQVRRGQIIAKAGQTGSVTSPQLHFEIRRGSQAVNPLENLDSAQLAGN